MSQNPRSLTREEVTELYSRPLLDLVFEAARIHRRHHDGRQIQCSSLLSIKTGGCPEDCAYCPQSAHYQTQVEAQPLLSLDQVLEAARNAQINGADRFCMGAAWRQVQDDENFDRVLEMVGEVKALGLETCVTLGMLNPSQARRLAQNGLDYYNHNLDTSPEFYSKVISTRVYEDRLRTLEAVRQAGIKLCCGGILGMGEGARDRIGLLYELARQDPQIESVPINTLVRVKGTPLEDQPGVSWHEMVRVVAVARLLIPRAKVRLSAGRGAMSEEAQALCFLAGANSIFLGDKLLTTPNPEVDQDGALLERLGLVSQGCR